jgi:hypothetical protein
MALADCSGVRDWRTRWSEKGKIVGIDQLTSPAERESHGSEDVLFANAA